MNKLSPELKKLLQGRRIAALATENDDGSIHLAAVWYLFEDDLLFVATAASTHKARNLRARPKCSLMVDSRHPGTERGVAAIGTVEIITGEASAAINRGLHSRYLSPAALADPAVGPVFAAVDDITIKLTPSRWISWDMGALDAQAFGGAFSRNPGYMLPLE